MDIKLKDNPKLKLSNITQLEYIESTGTQWIDTGFKPNQDTRVIIEFNDLNQSVTFLFGSRTSRGNAEFGYINGSVSGQGARYGNQERTLAITHNVKLILDANKTHWTLSNGKTVDFDNTTFQSTQNCGLFGFNDGGSISYVTIKVYSCKIYDSSILVRDFIPCKDLNDIVCLYDTVSKTFFYNQGTGSFIAGPVVVQGLLGTIFKKTTTLYHKTTPNVNGLVLLNSIFNYQKTHQDEVKEYYYPTTQLWQDIITEYPDIVQYYNMNHKLCVYICDADDPEQFTEGLLSLIDDYPDIIDVIINYPDISIVLVDNPNLAPIIVENQEVVHSLVNTGYEPSIKGNGAQYIDTGLTGEYTMEIQLRLKYGNDNRNDIILGNQWDAGAYLLHRYKPSNYVIRAYWGGYADCLINDVTKFMNIAYKANSASINNVHYSMSGTPSKVAGNIMLLGLPNSSYFNQVSQLSYYKRYDGNNLIQWLVPIENNNNPCMIDLLTGTKYLNQGTGSFTYSLEPKNA